jgi:phosphohistidine phosphatase
MRLYLIQHAQAASEQQDPQRPLTPEGRQDAEKVAHFLKPLGLVVDRVWHSGKARAWQTAQIYAGVLTVRHELTARAGLDPNDDVAPLRDELTVAAEDTMLVGHMPFVSKLASLLLTGHEFLPAIAFKNAGVVCLSRTPDNRWQVEWIVTPELLP